MQVDIPPSLHSYIDAALLRLQIQFPDVGFARGPCGIQANAETPPCGPDMRVAVLHAVYREKIYAETRPLREALFRAVLE
ncbi:MAG: hypothetical protein K0S56_2364 [Microvirga sp.]|jgi:hypothetical protein|nr:hypothetical protein [Microvirga sp.]